MLSICFTKVRLVVLIKKCITKMLLLTGNIQFQPINILLSIFRLHILFN